MHRGTPCIRTLCLPPVPLGSIQNGSSCPTMYLQQRNGCTPKLKSLPRFWSQQASFIEGWELKTFILFFTQSINSDCGWNCPHFPKGCTWKDCFLLHFYAFVLLLTSRTWHGKGRSRQDILYRPCYYFNFAFSNGKLLWGGKESLRKLSILQATG